MRVKRIHIKVDEFPEHHFPLAFSFPPSVGFHKSHDVLFRSNILIIENLAGYKRVYLAGHCEEEEIKHLLKHKSTPARKQKT